jgi:hypothetical protein
MSKPKLTQKQAKLVKGVVAGKTQAQAYIDAYDTKGHLPTVEVEASKTLNKPQVKEALEQAMAAKGITADKIAQVIADGLDAGNTLVINGEPTDIKIPDYSVRHKYLETTIRLSGVGKDTDTTNNQFIQINNTLKGKYDE